MNEDIVFDLEKYKAVIHYIIDKCSLKDNVERTVLQKLLYFSDFDHYEIFDDKCPGLAHIECGVLVEDRNEVFHPIKPCKDYALNSYQDQYSKLIYE